METLLDRTIIVDKMVQNEKFWGFGCFQEEKNEATFIMSKARNEFYTQFMEENSEDQGKLFSAAKELLAVENKLSFPDHLDKNKLATKAAKFFVIKVDGIPSDIDSMKILVTETHGNISLGIEQRLESFQMRVMFVL